MGVFSLRTFLPGFLSLGLLTSQIAWSWPPGDASIFEALSPQSSSLPLCLEIFDPQYLPPLEIDPQYDIFMPIVDTTPTGQPLAPTIPKPDTAPSKKRKKTTSLPEKSRPSKKQKSSRSPKDNKNRGTAVIPGYFQNLFSLHQDWEDHNAAKPHQGDFWPMQVERKGATDFQVKRATDFHKYRARSFYGRGLKYYNEKNYKLAARDFTTALNLNDKWNGENGAVILLARANAFFDSQDYDKASADFELYREQYTELDYASETRRTIAYDRSTQATLGSNRNIEQQGPTTPLQSTKY